MNDGDDAEPLPRNAVHHAIAAHDQLAEMLVPVFGNHAPQPRVPAKPFDRSDDPVCRRLGVHRGIPTDEVDNLTQILLGSYRPADLSHLERRRFTSA